MTAAHAEDHGARLRRRLALVDAELSRGDFRPRWDSLGRYRIPEWYRDAKFGIFIHWGVYSVPAFANEWYPRNMYLKGNPAFQHHLDTYGPQSKFGYKDFIPLFTASKFDAEAWVDLFQQAGASYIVPVAEHCDGFPMYASDFTDWNASRMGPKRDVVAEIGRATRKHGLHFGASSHRAEHWWWYNGGTSFDSDVNNPDYAGLYGPAQPTTLPGDLSGKDPDPNHLERWLPPDRAFLDDWLARSTEIVDKYKPDFLYFDWWIGQPAFQPYLQRMAAYYYDRAAEWKQGVVLTYKEHDFPENAAVLDVERAKLDALRLLPWQTDTSVSVKSWGYVEHDTYRSAKSLIAELVDVVSKNGNLLLNVGPRADGTIPEQARQVLLEMGRWLRVNGEAIYGTRPWMVYGEGTTSDAGSTTMGSDNQAYTARDIRFTTKSGTLYAIALGWPGDGKLTIRTLWSGSPYLSGAITRVELLGSPEGIRWQQTQDGLALDLPPTPPNDLAYVFKIVAAGDRTAAPPDR
jgi:alpha-L-fucosidase